MSVPTNEATPSPCPGLRHRAGRLAAIATLLLIPAVARAQAPASPPPDPLGAPTEYGLRLTPTMVRTAAGSFTRELLVGRYELDEAEANEISERMSRRIMAAAHAHGAEVQSLLEFFLTGVAEDDARTREPGHSGEDTFMTPEFCRHLAEQALPLVPAVHDLVREVGQDLRPMLSLKQQLKLGADLTLIGGTLKVFEHNLQRWAQGQAVPGENPFSAESDPGSRDANGQSQAMKAARQSADEELDKRAQVKSIWESYLKQTKAFYALDEGQCATADSVFREFMGKLENTLRDEQWRRSMYETRLWIALASQVGLDWHSPLREVLDRRYQRLMDPVNRLGDEFRLRLEQIPTTAQRTAADDRISEALAAQGYRISLATPEK